MYTIQHTGSFKKDLKTLKKRSLSNFEFLRILVKELQQKGALNIDTKYKTHKLSGKYAKHWECHVLNDLLLIWLQDDKSKIITLVRTGTHSNLFK